MSGLFLKPKSNHSMIRRPHLPTPPPPGGHHQIIKMLLQVRLTKHGQTVILFFGLIWCSSIAIWNDS